MTFSGKDDNTAPEERAPNRDDIRRALELRNRTLAYGLEDGVFELMIGLTLLVMAGHRYWYAAGHTGFDYGIAALYIVLMPILLWLGVRFRAHREETKGSLVEKYGPVFSRFGVFVLAGIAGMNLYVPDNNFLGTGLPDAALGIHLSAIIWLIGCLIMRSNRFFIYGVWGALSYIVALILSPYFDFGGATQRFQIFGILASLPPIFLGSIIFARYIRGRSGYDKQAVEGDPEEDA